MVFCAVSQGGLFSRQCILQRGPGNLCGGQGGGDAAISGAGPGTRRTGLRGDRYAAGIGTFSETVRKARCDLDRVGDAGGLDARKRAEAFGGRGAAESANPRDAVE